MTPVWVAAILQSRAVLILARAMLALVFVVPGVMQAVQFPAALGEFAHFNLHPTPVYVVASIVTLLGGSAVVIVGGKWTWLGAGALGVYTALTIFIVHHFWTLQGQAAATEQRFAVEHVSVIGALILVSILEHRRALQAL
jgi:transmembrane protein